MRVMKEEHNCEGTTGWIDVYKDGDGDWVLNVFAGDAIVEISYCPFCGEKLEKVST